MAPAPVQSEHQLPQQPLTGGVHADEHLELADHRTVLAEHQVGVDTILQRSQAHFLQARDLAVSERLIGQIGERFPAPQRQRRAQQLSRAPSVTVGERPAPVRDHDLELLDIDLTRHRREQVTAATRQQHLVAERLAQMRHVSLQRLRRRRRRALPPKLIDQAIARDRLPTAQQQNRQQRPLLRAAKHNRPLLLDHLKRPQDTELKHDP